MRFSFALVCIFLVTLQAAVSAEEIDSKEKLIEKMNNATPEERKRLRKNLNKRTRLKNRNKKLRNGFVYDGEDMKALHEKMKNSPSIEERKKIMREYRMKNAGKFGDAKPAKPAWMMDIDAYKKFAESVKDLPKEERLEAKKNFRKMMKEKHMKDQEE
mmetsp:Transcript_13390/g.20348  ORF Transcript_13390/g.20348 Transcript_13390/m.20348 type:complete len:158 (-) Transcript_13390:305-778(-)|eukprot:CAMPEP_0196806540 /NCGR_PEP_ID=MMETSP1362-20130617/6430_1 /TAXON_ID=163516 /ORGANISM="Leptocylindrus danicus, Strain CCMP1856" /LENGTH=157 /DNA_ID=CAMNT_0042180047 /DNA_START=42 /DNA_END=515 /DNA_ORIENTATION=-